MFLSFPQHEYPPILAPVYAQKEGLQIFKEWIEQFGINDVNDEIRIAIIKGINKDHPYWYRVVIGSNITKRERKSGQQKIFSLTNRLHTMEAQTDKNLKMFEEELKNSPVYEINKKQVIYKRKSSITICNAWENKEDDFFMYTGIMPNDNPTIPKGVDNPPVLKIIENHKQFRDSKIR